MFTTSDWRIGRAQLRGPRNRTFVYSAAIAFAGLMVLGFGSAGRAAAKALDFESAPITDVVAQIDKTFGVNITIKPGVNADGMVTFTVPNVDNVGARLEAINDLANALNADYTKVFVISNATGEATRQPAIDAVEAPVVFRNSTMSVADAIRLIAAIDDASVQFYSPVSGTVMLSSAQMLAQDAAREIARQTHTVWKAYYQIVPRKPGAARRDVGGEKVIGYTAGGQPITELPISTFRTAQVPETPPATTPEAAKPSSEKSGKDTGKATADKGDSTAATATPQYPYGYYPYPAYPGYYPGIYPGYYPGYGGGPVVLGPGMGVTGYGATVGPYTRFGTGYGYTGYGNYNPGGATVIGAGPISLMPFGRSWY